MLFSSHKCIQQLDSGQNLIIAFPVSVVRISVSIDFIKSFFSFLRPMHCPTLHLLGKNCFKQSWTFSQVAPGRSLQFELASQGSFPHSSSRPSCICEAGSWGTHVCWEQAMYASSLQSHTPRQHHGIESIIKNWNRGANFILLRFDIPR